LKLECLPLTVAMHPGANRPKARQIQRCIERTAAHTPSAGFRVRRRRKLRGSATGTCFGRWDKLVPAALAIAAGRSRRLEKGMDIRLTREDGREVRTMRRRIENRTPLCIRRETKPE